MASLPRVVTSVPGESSTSVKDPQATVRSVIGSFLLGLHGPDTSENFSELRTTVLTPALVTGSSVLTLQSYKGHASVNQLSGEISALRMNIKTFFFFTLKTFR